ncbi:MAG: methyltransferase domain-containing protein [Planctomycetota bacterium]
MVNDSESAVTERYTGAAHEREEALCCPVDYDPKYLEAIPDDVLERDYGCGDPSAWLREGETVLDLGSGGGKICFIASQVVGPRGRVIGVDMNDDMLALARGAAPVLAERLGYANVEFRQGRIQDLASDPARAAAHLFAHPVQMASDVIEFERFMAEQRATSPLIASDSVDVVVSNCVLNLVRSEDKAALFDEIFRVTRVGGRVVISDIVADEEVPDAMQANPELWSGCVSGALREDLFLQAFLDAGFYGVRILKRDEQPWRTVEGIEFRSVTVEAFKGKQGLCWDHLQAVVYKGPFSAVVDDDGHRIPRGVRYAVCEKTYRLYSKEPYREHFEFVEPLEAVPGKEARPFDCERDALRHPRETKGVDYDATMDGGACCGPDGC